MRSLRTYIRPAADTHTRWRSRRRGSARSPPRTLHNQPLLRPATAIHDSTACTRDTPVHLTHTCTITHRALRHVRSKPPVRHQPTPRQRRTAARAHAARKRATSACDTGDMRVHGIRPSVRVLPASRRLASPCVRVARPTAPLSPTAISSHRPHDRARRGMRGMHDAGQRSRHPQSA